MKRNRRISCRADQTLWRRAIKRYSSGYLGSPVGVPPLVIVNLDIHENAPHWKLKKPKHDRHHEADHGNGEQFVGCRSSKREGLSFRRFKPMALISECIHCHFQFRSKWRLERTRKLLRVNID